jgi:hypothetical protein
MQYTLAEWQNLLKPVDDLIVNASSTDGKDAWVPFPIGMGAQWLRFKADTALQRGPHDQLLYVALNPTSDRGRRGKTPLNRLTFIKTLAAAGFYDQYTNPKAYFFNLPNYKFVASPEGNGIDCHRHAEAIMAGCIPIVEDHPGIREKYQGLPVLYTTNFKEITRGYLVRKYKEMLNETYDFSRLFVSWYPEDVQAQIQENSSYWIKKLI